MNTNRWSRQSAATSSSSLTAAQSSQERSERRLSRLSPSDFESILSSDKTLQLAGAGRDESLLGDQDGDAGSSDNNTALAASSSTPYNPPPSLPPAEMGTENQRPLSPRTIVRDGFTASSPDLSAARRRSEAQAALAFAAVEGKGKGKAIGETRRSDDLARGEMEPPPTPTKDQHSLPPLTPTRSRTQQQHPAIFSTPSASSSRRPSATPSYTKLSMPADLTPVAHREPSSSSYVHVERPSEERPSRGPQYDSVASLGLPDASPKRRKGSLALGAGLAPAAAGEENRSAFSNTMRRTSRFFRKLGGGSTATPAPKTPAPSATPKTPIANAFSSPSAAPPVPAHSPSDRRPSAVSSSSVSPTRTRDAPLPPRRSSIDIAIHSPKSSASAQSQQGPTSAELIRDGSNQSLSPKDVRRRSLSMNSATAAGLARMGSSGSERSTGGGSGRGVPPKHSPNKSEEERLKRELQHWKLDMDGVLGSVGGASPASTRAGTAASTPRVELPSFTPIEAAFMGRSTSTPPRRPTWADEWRAGGGVEEPKVTSRSASLPTSSLSPLPPIPTDELPDDGRDIKVVDPAGSVEDGSPVEMLATPTMDGAQDEAESDARSNTADLPPPVPIADPSPDAEPGLGLGLGLPTITESAHSRDNSLATPTKERLDTTPRRPSTSEGSSIPPFVLTESPSTPAPLPAIKLSNQRNKAARQSLVTHPSSSSSITRNSLPGSKNASSTSLSSDPQRQEGKGQPVGEAIEEQAKDAAKRCWDEDVTFLPPKKIAEWLGSPRPLNAEALRIYIDMFDFTGLRLDLAFRRLCNKLYLKAETQQVDRILAQFSRRYWETNPSAVYGSADVVHAVSYSLLLLNTDLHIVDSDRRMTRAQFVRNTLSAISMQQDDLEPGTTPALLFRSNNGGNDSETAVNGVFGGEEGAASTRSLDKTALSRNGSVVSWETSSPNLANGSPQLGRDSPYRSQLAAVRSESSMTVNSTGSGGRAADVALEATLKEMYNAVKTAPIFQPHSSSLDVPESFSRSSLSLTPNTSPYATWSGVNRSASRRSATSTMSGSSNAYKRSSVRGFGNLLGTSSSIEFMRSGSPTPSTATSITDDNYSTAYGASSHHHVPTIGFANSLSHTIIREQQEDDTKSDNGVSISDEELALLGAPWAKEGILHRKHYWESVGKRSKEKNWLQAFIVVSAGELRMFRFDGAGSTRGTAEGMGGGDWTSNANSVGEVSLTHALCSAMPPPGYSKDRPYCFVLTMPDGGSYFFQAGTQDLVAEWVSTCNYWSARLSKEPLPGGVSNMEYGWNRVVPSKLPGDDDRTDTMSVRSSHSRMSYQAFGQDRRGGNNPNDSIVVNDWKPPNAPLGASNLSEDAQLDNLKRHVAIVKAELAHHNTLRTPMIKLYSARSANLAKASANWERKSQHLLAEIVKYQTYIEALTAAIKLRALKRGQKEVEQMLESADVDEEDEDDVAISPTDGPGTGAFAMPSPQRPVINAEELQETAVGAEPEEDEDEPEAGPTRLSMVSGTTTDEDVFLDAAQGASTPRELSPSP